MAALTIQSIVPAATTPTYAAAAAGGDTVACPTDQLTFVHVKNGSGASITVTVAAAITSVPNALAGTQTVANNAIAIAAGTERMIGPFPQAFIDGNGNVNLTYSAVTSLTLGAFRLPRVA
jgi:hypothetical protein